MNTSTSRTKNETLLNKSTYSKMTNYVDYITINGKKYKAEAFPDCKFTEKSEIVYTAYEAYTRYIYCDGDLDFSPRKIVLGTSVLSKNFVGMVCLNGIDLEEYIY